MAVSLKQKRHFLRKYFKNHDICSRCHDHYYGNHCEFSTFGFDELSYTAFPALDPNTNDISVTFATSKPNALLVYNYGKAAGGRSDFLAVELVAGRPRLSWGGGRTAVTSLVLPKQVCQTKTFLKKLGEQLGLSGRKYEKENTRK
jgi:hypothetical protein